MSTIKTICGLLSLKVNSKENIMNDRIDIQQYFLAVPTERLLRNNTFITALLDMASATLPDSKPIGDEAYDKNSLACVDFYSHLATAMVGSLELTGEEAIDAGLQYASCARVYDAVVACMKNLRSEIDGWLEACEDDKS